MSTVFDPDEGRLRRAKAPVSIVILFLLPLILMPLAAVFVFAFRGGPKAFVHALAAREAQFALRFSLLIAFATAAINAVLGTYTAYVLSRYRFRGQRPPRDPRQPARGDPDRRGRHLAAPPLGADRPARTLARTARASSPCSRRRASCSPTSS